MDVFVVGDNVCSSTNNGVHRTEDITIITIIVHEGVFLLVLPATIDLLLLVVVVDCSSHISISCEAVVAEVAVASVTMVVPSQTTTMMVCRVINLFDLLVLIGWLAE